MKLYYSPTSPYVRKVTVTALETGLDADMERIPADIRDPIRPSSPPTLWEGAGADQRRRPGSL